MLKFEESGRIPAGVEPPRGRMTLVEYARFSERCLRSCSTITPENCLTKRADERKILVPFKL